MKQLLGTSMSYKSDLKAVKHIADEIIADRKALATTIANLLVLHRVPAVVNAKGVVFNVSGVKCSRQVWLDTMRTIITRLKFTRYQSSSIYEYFNRNGKGSIRLPHREQDVNSLTVMCGPFI